MKSVSKRCLSHLCFFYTLPMIKTDAISTVLFLFASLLSSIVTGTLTLRAMAFLTNREDKENAIKKFVYRQLIFFYPLLGISFVLTLRAVTHDVKPQNLISICGIIYAAIYSATSLWTGANQWVNDSQISLVPLIKKSLWVVFTLLIALLFTLI